MNNKYLIITGGTGGHVIPAENFGNFLKNKNINCSIIVDKRGYKYLNYSKNKIYVIRSSNLNGNLISKFFGIINLLLGFIQSMYIIFSIKPNKVITFGSYASFFQLYVV